MRELQHVVYLLLQAGSDKMLYMASHTCTVSKRVSSLILDACSSGVWGGCMQACDTEQHLLGMSCRSDHSHCEGPTCGRAVHKRGGMQS